MQLIIHALWCAPAVLIITTALYLLAEHFAPPAPPRD